ncbi:MAG: rod shape-determining protein MreC [Azoarcus sp.]|jgi:rod shape-determining protein MreC|nr:rod shape-determining protein MreC [Azoarcus sp.]
MSVSDFQTHPVFRRGVSAKVRLLAYLTICVVVVVSDLRFRYMEPVRQYVFTAVSPLRMVASEPVKLLGNATDHFSSLADLQEENARFRQHQLDGADRLLRFDELEQENAKLRSLLGMRKKTQVKSIAAEVLYSVPDSSSRKVILDQGKKAGITHGLAVVDADGLLGQVTRIYSSQAEVTLITDRNQAVPVQVERNGLRGVMFGVGQGLQALGDVPKRWQQAIQGDTGPGSLELRFVLANADIQPEDRLVTSGLDGIFPAGLPVAEVESVDREAGAFARITCRPLGGVDKSLRVLVLGRAELPPPQPKPETGEPPPPPVPPRAVRQFERN